MEGVLPLYLHVIRPARTQSSQCMEGVLPDGIQLLQLANPDRGCCHTAVGVCVAKGCPVDHEGRQGVLGAACLRLCLHVTRPVSTQSPTACNIITQLI